MRELPRPTVDEVLQRTDAVAAMREDDLAARAAALGDEFLDMGEAVLETWLEAKGTVPTEAVSEGFKLLALHRQGARGDPSFNACRETCREIVYHRNLIYSDLSTPDVAKRVRLGAMVVRHLALFIAGKLETAGLGEFCCSSRQVRGSDDITSLSETA